MLRKLVALLAALTSAVGFAQSSGEARFRPGFENDRVAAFLLDLPPGYHAQIYQYSHDTIWVALDDATAGFVQEHQEQKTSARLQLKPGEARFFPSFQAKSIVNQGAAGFRAVLVEIKPRGLASGCGCTGVAEKAVCGCGNAAHLPSLWAVGIGQITLAGTTLAPDEGFRTSIPRDDMLLIAVTDVELRDDAVNLNLAPSETEAAVLRLKSGEAAWIKEGRHRFRNVGAQAARFVTVEF